MDKIQNQPGFYILVYPAVQQTLSDDEKNSIRGQEVEISTKDSKVKVWVIPTNEELLIARDTLAIVSK